MTDPQEPRWWWYSAAKVPCLVFGTTAHDQQEVLVQEEVAIRLNSLTRERDEAVREAGELRAKAKLADEVFGSKWFDWYNTGLSGAYACIYCDAEAAVPEAIEHNENCPKARYDSLTPDQAASTDEPCADCGCVRSAHPGMGQPCMDCPKFLDPCTQFQAASTGGNA